MKISNKKFYDNFVSKTFGDENTKPKGKATITLCKIETPEAKELQNKVDKAMKEGSFEEYQELKNELHSKFTKKQIVINNLVTRIGRTVLARILSGDTAYSGEINYCALGTGDAASTTGDSTLATELYRKQTSSKTYSTYHSYVSTFFAAGDCSGTYKEIGHFIDGSASADSGQLWSRIADPETAELPVTKSNSESLTIDYDISL